MTIAVVPPPPTCRTSGHLRVRCRARSLDPVTASDKRSGLRGARHLADMSPAPGPEHWSPDLPHLPETLDEQTFTVSATSQYLVQMFHDERGRLAKWAVIQQRNVNGRWLNVALYDSHPPKGFHVHRYDVHGRQYTEMHIRPVTSYREFEAALDDASMLASESWLENERRSDRGE